MVLSFYLDVQELQHAVSAQQIASPHPYKKDYKEQIVGKGPHDPTIGYPEHDHHKKVGELTSSVNLVISSSKETSFKKNEYVFIRLNIILSSRFCNVTVNSLLATFDFFIF